jgi:hypothetical protein
LRFKIPTNRKAPLTPGKPIHNQVPKLFVEILVGLYDSEIFDDRVLEKSI